MIANNSLLLSFFLILGLYSCSSIPKSATTMSPFDKEKYLGKWYEIVRMDFKFEKDLNNTIAEYGVREYGEIGVPNKGYNYVKQAWTEAVGKAKFVGNETEAKLKVSFFWSFYSGYNVIALYKYYNYAFVAGGDLSFLWILSRETTLPDKVKGHYLKIAKDLGYKTEELIWVKHNK
jgi:apolipoprotein D and lipocalin family protein